LKAQEACDLGSRLALYVAKGDFRGADELLIPVLNTKTSFALLDIIGKEIGKAPLTPVNTYLRQIALGGTMGGWVVIASGLRCQFESDFPGAFQRCDEFTRLSSTWYGVDIFGERVPGPALVLSFDRAVEFINLWRTDPDRWIRRMVGVAVHYWAKQAHGNDLYCDRVRRLFEMLEPMFSERHIDAVKGVGWGLKTLGRYYPSILTDWLVCQNGRPHTALMMRKAVTFLPDDMKIRAQGYSA
jgi:hypothetical protein